MFQKGEAYDGYGYCFSGIYSVKKRSGRDDRYLDRLQSTESEYEELSGTGNSRERGLETKNSLMRVLLPGKQRGIKERDYAAFSPPNNSSTGPKKAA